MAEKVYNIKNRSASRVCYSIPEDKIRRVFAPGEVKRITYSELQKLMWQPGGKEMVVNFLQIQNEVVLKELNIPAQPEYYMSEAQIVELIKTGSLEAFLDCLDFAPVGVVDLIKQFSVTVPLADYAKKDALKQKTGFDVEQAIRNAKADSTDETAPVAAAQPSVGTVTGRRTSPNYNVVNTNVPKYNVVNTKTVK